MKMISAEEAVKIATLKKSQTEDITHLMAIIETQVSSAAADGKFGIRNPLGGIRQPVTRKQQEAVNAELKRLGFTVKDDMIYWGI